MRFQGRKVLVVEDTSDIRSFMRLMLEMKGVIVIEATNGQEALTVASREHPDLILMDLHMPVLDGFEATRLLRQQEEMKATPMVALTAHHWKGDWKRRAERAGCTECYKKPVEFDTLDTILERYIA